MRSADVKVLTVGGLVFSSDPRMSVIVKSINDGLQSSWSLKIKKSALSDSGEYKCQVNTEPTISKTVVLYVASDKKKETEIKMLETEKQNKYAERENHTENYDNSTTHNPALRTEEIKHSKIMDKNAAESKQDSSSEFLTSIIIPLCSLASIALLVTFLGVVRLCYSWKLNPKGESRQRRLSHSGALERRQSSSSLRSSNSRRSSESVSSRTSRRSRKRSEHRNEKIYMQNYSSGRLSPLEEVKEPTPKVSSKKPLYLVVRLDSLDTTNDDNEETNEAIKNLIEVKNDSANKTASIKNFSKYPIKSDVRSSLKILNVPDNEKLNDSSPSISHKSCDSASSTYVETSKVISVQKYSI